MYLYILVYTFLGDRKTNKDVNDIHLGGVSFYQISKCLYCFTYI